jgi:hypothetical protein
LEGDVKMTYSEAAVKKAYSKYGFTFKIDGEICSTWYDQKKHRIIIDCLFDGGKLVALGQEVERLINEVPDDFKSLDVRKFLFKYIRTMAKVEEELKRATISERRYELLNSKPLDLESLSLEEQCLAEVLLEQSEKDEKAAAATGQSTNVVEGMITAEMVKAKLEEKKRKQK